MCMQQVASIAIEGTVIAANFVAVNFDRRQKTAGVRVSWLESNLKLNCTHMTGVILQRCREEMAKMH